VVRAHGDGAAGELPRLAAGRGWDMSYGYKEDNRGGEGIRPRKEGSFGWSQMRGVFKNTVRGRGSTGVEDERYIKRERFG